MVGVEMHRKLFVMIGCAAVVVGSAVARSLEGWKLPMVADYEEAPISCNHYNLANYSFNTVSTKGLFPIRELNYSPVAEAENLPYVPFIYDEKLVMSDECAVFVDTMPSSTSRPSLLAHWENFVTSLEREAEEARFEYVFSFDDTISITTYLDPFNENTLLLAAQRPGLSQLSEHEGRVVWVQLKAESTTEYKIASFDLFARQYSPLPSLEPPPGVSFTAPQVCDDFLSFVQYDSATGASSIVVYEFSTDTHEIIALGTPGSNHFSARMDQYGRLWPVVNVTSTEARAASDRDVNLAIELEEGADKAGFEVNAAIASDSTQFHGCRLAWVETAQPVKMEGGQVLPDTPHGGVEDGIIRVVDLPHRRIRAASGPSEWGVEASVGPGFGAQLDDVESEEWRQETAEGSGGDKIPYTVLTGLQVSENQIFATVSALDPTGVAFSRHRVVSRRVINSRGSELPATMTHWPQTDSRLPLRLGSASSQTVAIHQEREGRWLSTLLQLSETRAAKHDGLEDNYPVLCTLAEGSTGLLGIYRDVVVWREQGVDNLRFLDVNKDNDFVLDAGDWFPVTGSAMFDSDNDGISDEADIITVGGSCTRSERRSACISDITILYLVWMSYVILVNIPVFFITRWYLVHKRILRERAKHANIVDENQMYFVREGSAAKQTPLPFPKEKGRRSLTGWFSSSMRNMRDAEAGERELTEEEIKAMEMRMVVRRTQLISLVGQTFMLGLAIMSLIIALIPYLRTEPLAIRQSEIYSWIDFFTTYLFLVDLVCRYITRNPDHTPNMRSFVKKNWADFLALFTDIPGVTSAGALHFLVLTRFRHVLRVFRLARVLKIFRVSRMFRKTAQSKKMLDVMIYKPTFFMSGFLLVMILGFAIALKILEQHRNTTWASYGNVLWFSIVTVTTIGYGDMSPNTIGGRLVTTVMMALGIGMVGLLTATIIRSVLLGKSKGKIGQRKRERANRMEMLKTSAARMCMALNPMVVSFGEHLERSMGKKLDLVSTTMQHNSSKLNMVQGLDEEILMPIEELVSQVEAEEAGFVGQKPASVDPGGGIQWRYDPESGELVCDWTQAAGKFGSGGGGAAEMTEGEKQHKRLITEQRRALLSLLEKSMARSVVSPVEKLHFLLKFFKLDHGSEAVADCAGMAAELEDILFPDVRADDMFIGRVLALSLAMDDSGGLPSGVEADLVDPIDRRLVRVEEVLKRHKVDGRANYQEILLELTLLCVMYDRVQNAQYCLQALQFIPEMEPDVYPKAPVRHVDDTRKTQFSRSSLMPAFNFVGRRLNYDAITRMYRKQAKALANAKRGESAAPVNHASPVHRDSTVPHAPGLPRATFPTHPRGDHSARNGRAGGAAGVANREDSMEILPPVESPSQSAAGDKTHPEITWAGEGDEEGSVRPAGKERRSNLGGGFTDTRSERLPSAHRDSKKQQSQLSTEGDKGPAVVAAPQEPPLAPYVARRAAGAGAVRQGQGRRGESALAPVNTPARAGAGEAGEEGPVGAESVLPVVGGPTSSAGEREGGESGEDREGGSAVPAGVARLREEGRGGYSSARSSVQEGR